MSEEGQFSPQSPNPEEKIVGVFSTKVERTIGAGSTRRKTTSDIVHYVEEHDDGSLAVWALNANFIPMGDPKFITREQLFKEYTPEPEIYMKKTLPNMRQLNKTLAKAERNRLQGNNYTAEYEFKEALTLDEVNIRGMFGLGLVYLDRDQAEKADQVFKKLVRLRGTFADENKHLFNEFGIKLRKNKLFEQALKYYARAFKVSRKDEHLVYNIARIYFERGNYKTSLAFARHALKMNPDLEPAKELAAVAEKGLQRQRKKGRA